MRPTKCVIQEFNDKRLEELLRDCLALTYNAIRHGVENGIKNRKNMKEFYRSIEDVELPSCFKTAVITRACAIIKSRRKSDRRGIKTNYPKALRPAVCIVSGFFVTAKGRLFIPLERRGQYADLLLNRHARNAIEGKELRSVTITPNLISICYSKEAEPRVVKTVYGVDRNEKNLTFGNNEGIVQIDMSKMVKIKQTTREIVGSLKRNDFRIRRKLASRYWMRARNRTNQLLHASTNFAIELAMESGAALALEDIANIRKLFQKGKSQGPDIRFRMNSWPYQKAFDQLEYKSNWNGLTFIQLTRTETAGSSVVHWRCGERLHSPQRDRAGHGRMLWCGFCEQWVDRDVNAALNLSKRGLSRFDSSFPWTKTAQRINTREEGQASEAMKGNGRTMVPILQVDACKLLGRPFPDSAV